MSDPRQPAGRAVPPTRRPGPTRRARLHRALPVLAVLSLTAIVVAGLAVVPIQAYLTQRREMAQAEHELRRLETEVAELDAELSRLRTDEAVERIAREHYDLVFPGEESYRILPAAGS